MMGRRNERVMHHVKKRRAAMEIFLDVKCYLFMYIVLVGTA